MKRIISILLILFAAYSSFAQPNPPAPPVPSPYVPPSSVQRATAGNVVVDARVRNTYNMYVPKYTDTATASLPMYLGQDTCGAIIFTYDINNFWVRACSPKRWERVNGGVVLPDGVYSGGNVAWTGTGLIFAVSAATYVLGGRFYTYPGGTVTLTAADVTFDRIDVIILDSTGASFITGTPSASPQEPSINPQSQIRRALVTIPANSPTPLITTNILYDENLGQPSEWDVTSTGTVQFGDTQFPYHLTIDAAVSSLTNGQTITLSNSTTYNSSQLGSLDIFVALAAVWTNQNITINLMLNGVNVGQPVNFTTFGLVRNIINSYQAVIIPMPSFGAANLLFNQIQLTAVGDMPAFDLDFIQFQSGFTLFYSQQNAFTSALADDGNSVVATSPTSTLNIVGINNISTVADPFTNTFKINGLKLIRNDTYFSVPQPVSAVSVDRYVRITNPLTQSSILNISGNQSGVGALTTIRTSNQNCCAYVDYNYYNPLEVFSSATSSTHSLTNIRLGRTNNAYFESGFINYIYDGATAAQSHIGISFVDPVDSPIPFAFGADSTFKILRPILGGDNSFKLDVGAKSRFLDAVQSGYLTAGARVNDSSFIWKAYLDSVLLTKGSGTVTNIAFNTATGIRSTAEPITSTGTIRIDTTVIATRLYAANLVTTYFNFNLGSFFRLAVPNTNGIKGLTSGYALTWDSATANTLKISVDTTLMATRAYVGAAGGAGTVSAVSFNNANGFGGSWTNATTTPQLTLTTTITGLLKGNGTAISAAAGSDINTTFGSQTANFFYAAPNGSAGNPTFRAMVAADVPTLNQNTTGTAATITGVSTVAHGGTGLATLTAYGIMVAGTTATGNMQQVSGTGTAGQVLTSNGAAALPTWQAPATGVASITGTTNQVIASAATGAVTLSLPQSIATTSAVTFGRLTVGGTAATSPLTFVTNTDATAAAGRWYYNTTRLGFSLAATIQRVVLTTDAAPANGALPIGNGTGFQNGFITAADNGTLITNSAGGITVKSNSTPQTLTSAATITWNVANGENANLTLANTGATLNLTNPVSGHTYVIQITQGAGGSRTITTWPAGTVWPSGTAPVLGTAVGARNLISLYYNGTSFFGAFNPNIYQ